MNLKRFPWQTLLKLLERGAKCSAALITVALSVCVGPELVRAAESSKMDPNRIIQYRGPIPVLGQEYWGTAVELKFELYRSPDGGSPFWKEMRRVNVDKDGWVKIDLGEVARLPDEAFTTPFRFLAIWQGTVEFAPRKQVASLAYVASSLDEQILPSTTSASEKKSVKTSKAAVTDAAAPLGKLVDCGAIFMEKNPRVPGTWFKAMETAAQLKTRLPTFEEWYGAYDGESRGQLVGMTGHYEWVIPWVYEPTIHSRLHELYRGKSVACYYEELSPMNDYPFRLIVAKPEGASEKPSEQ
jgi:hypothetical protein